MPHLFCEYFETALSFSFTRRAWGEQFDRSSLATADYFFAVRFSSEANGNPETLARREPESGAPGRSNFTRAAHGAPMDEGTKLWVAANDGGMHGKTEHTYRKLPMNQPSKLNCDSKFRFQELHA